MAVRPIGFNADGSIDVLHDEMGHGGTVAPAQIAFGRDVGAAVDPRTIVLPCPVCGSVSSHPVSGGADGLRIQFLFALATLRRLRQSAPATTFAQAKAWVRNEVDQLDGDGRFAILRAAATDRDPAP